MSVEQAQDFAFLKGGGQMGEMMRLKDWSVTPLGSPEQWPQSLQISISILLNSQFPMFVWWGEDYLTFYNDAYRIILGDKHPKALGASGPMVWSEIWDVVGPMARRVQEEGKSNWAEDQLLYINRRGYVEESYFTFSYSPVLDERGQIRGVFCACTETTGKVLANRRLKESEEGFRNMILQAPVAMCILIGPEHVVDIANDAMIELWGKTRESVMQKPIFEALPDAKDQGLEKLIDDVYRTGVPFHGNERPVTLLRNGKWETVYQNFVYQPYLDTAGKTHGVLVISVDVTSQVLGRQKIEELVVQRTGELAQANQALVKSNEELKRLNANLEDFAYAASHDMKEPIRKIHFFSDRLKGELQAMLSEHQKHLFGRLEHASKRMGALIDDLLAYSHATRGLAETEEVDLNKKVQLVLEDLEVEIQQKGAKITKETLPVIKGNKRQMQQLFQNLITNALKYSKPETPPEVFISSKQVRGKEVKTDLLAEEGDRAFHLVEIRDNGIGFDQGDAERIFNVFTRLHSNAEYRGTGVGLSIVQKVVQNHGGYLWAESKPGKGSTFKILLPVNGMVLRDS